MEQVERGGSLERVRVLAEAVSLTFNDERLQALADALDATLPLLEDLEDLAAAGGPPASEGYDPAWRQRGARR